jgi:hypothetical protein
VQRGLKHHHERPVKAAPQLLESVAEHQSLLHSYAFV